MKTTLHYIIAILLFSLNATHAFAEEEKGPFNITNESGGITHSYNAEKALLTIGGIGSIKITGDRKPVQARIEIKNQSIVNLTIQDLHIQAEVPLTVNNHSGGDIAAVTNIILEGTNILESNAADSQPGMLIDWSTSISGSGSLTVKGSSRGGAGILYGEGYGVYFNPMTIQDNIVVVAIGGKSAEVISGGTLNHKGGLLIQGKVDGSGTIEHTSSALAGDLTLGTDFEIPSWATVTIPDGQSITVPEDKTLTNEGTLETEEGGSLTNKGSIINKGTLETENGTLVNEGTIETNGIKTSSKFLNIGGDDGFNVSTGGDRATFTYNAENKLLTISGGGGDALLEGIGQNNTVECGIVIAKETGIDLTIKDLNIWADKALVFEDQNPPATYNPILQGTNRLKSTTGPGINIHGNTLVIQGPGSLTVIGETEAFTTTGGSLSIRGNACVVAIGGEGVTSGITTFDFTSGLLISGTKQAGDNITQEYSGLKGDNITLGGNLEIPEWATVTIAAEQTFTIAPNVTLTNNGTINNEGTITNNGTLSFGVSGKLNGSLEQIKNEGGGKMVCDVSIRLFDGTLLAGINNLNLYNPQKGEYALFPNVNTYDISSLPVISDGYELRVGNYPVGQKITTPSGDWVGHVNVIRLSFEIGADKVDVIRVKDQPVPPYEPETPKPGHTLKWYNDDVYTTPMTNDDWKNTKNALEGKSIYGRWEANPDPVDPDPVEPDPVEPDPTPVYYSVYLPQVEGATTDPGPGEYEVESWDNFRFYLTIDSAYSESQPVVTTDRGETLVPRTSDGAYLVKYVRTDVEVFIDGLIQNPPPVANEAIGTAALVPRIWAEGTMLCIRMAEALPSAPVRIFTVDGRLYDSFASTPGLNRRQLPTGIYIVRVGEETACKVIIK